MCIIIAKEKYGRLPKEEELRNSFEVNSDGAGFMYVDNGKVVIDKGYMTYTSFLKHYKSLLKKYNNFKDKSLVIHCRIGTSGKNIKANTHPYPISNDIKKLKSRHLSEEKIGIVHNGIIHGYGTKTGLNDTQEFIQKYIYPIYSHWKDFYKNMDIMYGIEAITNSKFTILDTEDNLYYVGEFIDDKGLKFSNTTYKYGWYRGYSSHSYNYYDDGIEYDKYYDDDYWYDKAYEEQKKQTEQEKLEFEEGLTNEENLIPLEDTWSIDIYGNGKTEKVGKNEYYYDYETLELYEWNKGVFSLISINPIIYDEYGVEIWT